MPQARYQIAQVPEAPPHKGALMSLPRLLDFLGEQLIFRWLPFFIFQEGEETARAIWCHVCGHICWNTDNVRAWRCGFCRKRLRG